jgi:hypothetical protein
MNALVDTLWKYPEIAIFLALAIGYLIGPLKLEKFSPRSSDRAIAYFDRSQHQGSILPDVLVCRGLRCGAAIELDSNFFAPSLGNVAGHFHSWSCRDRQLSRP